MKEKQEKETLNEEVRAVRADQQRQREDEIEQLRREVDRKAGEVRELNE